MREWSWERAERFKGRSAGEETARAAIAGAVLGRKFGESMEDYLERDPNTRRLVEAAKTYLKKEK